MRLLRIYIIIITIKGAVSRLSSSRIYCLYPFFFLIRDLTLATNLLVFDKITASYQANISPKALYQTIQTTKMNFKKLLS